AGIHVPLMHIAEATAKALLEKGIKRVGLLGTKYTMTQEFYRDKLVEAGLEVLTPDEADMDIVHRVIYDELCLGIVRRESKEEYLRIIGTLAARGAQAVILGCTEIGLLVGQEDMELPVFDTTKIHAEQAVCAALGA
ncbi:MAG: amino acid racemase, partial [Clostridiales bacterium]|nr:amino acid racemase [Clostridiales bacterium]